MFLVRFAFGEDVLVYPIMDYVCLVVIGFAERSQFIRIAKHRVHTMKRLSESR